MSEERLRMVLDAVPALISYVDKDHRQQFINKAYEDWFGARREAVIGLHIKEVLGDHAYTTLREYIDQALAGETVEYEITVPYRDGGERVVQATCVPDYGNDGTVEGLHIFFQDLTKTMRALLEREKSETQAQAIAEISPAGIFMNRISDGEFLFANPAGERLFGCPAGELVGRLATDFYVDPVDWDTLKEDMHRDERPRSFDVLFKREDGAEFWTLDSARALPDGERMMSTLVDITDQKQAEVKLEQRVRERTKELHNSEARLGTAANLARLGYYVWDTRADRCKFCSEEYAKIRGVSVNEFLEHASTLDGPFSFTHPEDQEEYRRSCKAAANGESYDIQYRIIRRDGETRWLHEVSSPVFDENGRVLEKHGIAQDITEHKQAVEALREAHDKLEQKVRTRTQELVLSESRLNRTASVAKVGHWIWDDLENKALSCSDECARIHGVSVEEYISSTFASKDDDKWVHPDDLAQWIEVNRCLNETHERYDIVYRLIPHHGDTRWVREIAEAELDESGVHVRTHGVIQDITESHIVEMSLKESEEHLRQQQLVTDQAELTANYGSWMWDEVNNIMLYCSPGLARLHGMTPDEFLSVIRLPERDPRLVHPDDVDKIDEYWARPMGAEDKLGLEYRFVHPDGDIRWVRDVWSAVDVSDTGEALTSVGSTYDITDFKRLEIMKSEFISSVNHELRTPLTSVMGALGLAKSGQFGDVHPDIQRLLDIAYDNCTRLSQLTDDILDVDKIMSEGMTLALASINVASLIHEAVQANQNYGDLLGITYEADFLDNTINAIGDKNRLLQVLSNLMSNAAKFSAQGDKVKISMDCLDDSARIAVTDQGCGIPEEFRETIFDRFTQVDASDTRNVTGSGLGLNISKAIVELHGGTIGFDSQIGIGSTFFFTLPIVK